MTDNIKQRDDRIALVIAEALAREDGFDPADQDCGLYDLRWSGGVSPEPLGDAWKMDYLPRGERIAAALREQHSAHGAGEPVAWQFLCDKVPGPGQDWVLSYDPNVWWGEGKERRALYTRPQPAGDPQYDRALIADMLGEMIGNQSEYYDESIEEQQRLLREADNRVGARTVNRSVASDELRDAEQDDDIVRRMSAAMREADETFERVGGSTRHHVRDCLLPVLAKHGLRIQPIDAAIAAQQESK